MAASANTKKVKTVDPLLAWTEAELQATVLALAGRGGWHRWHTVISRFIPRGREGDLLIDKGFPDLVLARNGTVIFAELKRQKGRVTPEQKEWLELLGGVVWRPSDMPEIEKILA